MSYIHFNKLYFFSFLFFLCSCNDAKKDNSNSKLSYFDIAGFLKNEVSVLTTKKTKVTKTIIKDGEKETKEIVDIDWEKELKIFSETDINKPAWKQSFSGDTTKTDSSYTVQYKTTDIKIPVKEMIVYLDTTWQCTEFFVSKKTKNFLYTSEQQFFYSAGKSYRLESKMSVIWVFDTHFSVEGIFNNN